MFCKRPQNQQNGGSEILSFLQLPLSTCELWVANAVAKLIGAPLLNDSFADGLQVLVDLRGLLRKCTGLRNST
jgi:hypothetical protein